MVGSNSGTSRRHPLIELFLPAEVLVALLIGFISVGMRHPESYFDVIQLLSLEFLNLLLLNDGSVPISSAIETINALPDRHICPEFLIFFAPLAARSNLWSPKIDIPIICLAVTRELDSQLLILNGHNVANGPAFAFESGIDLDCFDRVGWLPK